MSIAATIREKLMIALRPTRLDVINESHVHAGHQSGIVTTGAPYILAPRVLSSQEWMERYAKQSNDAPHSDDRRKAPRRAGLSNREACSVSDNRCEAAIA